MQGVNASLFTLLPSSSCLSIAGVNIPVGQSCTLAVQFKPTAAVIPNTVYFASLILNLNTPSPLKIPLSGKVNNTPQVYYIHPDHLNTPRMITDVGGKVVWQWENTEPFGNNTPNQNPSGLGTFEYNPRFPGQYFDKETGLNYNGFRDYDPAIGRYVESDPIGLAGGINTYGYVDGNPLGWRDLFGLAKINLAPPNSGEWKQGESAVDSPNKMIVQAHSDYKGHIIGPDKQILPPGSLAKEIRRHKDWREGMPIELRICAAGSGDNPIVDQLKKYFPNSKISGPIGDVAPNGWTFIPTIPSYGVFPSSNPANWVTK